MTEKYPLPVNRLGRRETLEFYDHTADFGRHLSYTLPQIQVNPPLPPILECVGWTVYEDERFLVIARERVYEPNDVVPLYGELYTIIKAAIVERSR